MSNFSNNKRIARNTAILYARTLLSMFVSLYTSRIILQSLGVEDFGIYNVVGGIVVMFSFLNSSMSSATQRYFSFSLGKGDLRDLRDLFSITLNIHFLIAFVIVLLSETVGLWFLNTHLNIPENKINAANWVFQFSVLTFFLNVISVPYNAMIISNERMNVYAYVSLFETFAKFGIVCALSLFVSHRLVFFAGLVCAISVVVRIFYGIYCSRQFDSCRYRWIWDTHRYRELLRYAAWNLFGNLAAVGFSQGVNMLLNIFFGPLLNAANGIANQINGAIMSFVGNFQMALNPQIVKSYAGGEREYMQMLIFQGSRFSFYLLLVFMTPVLLQTELLLGWWLKEIPVHAVLFTRLVMLNALLNSLSGTLMTAAQATGKIKRYQAIVGGILLLNVPMSYLFLRIGYSAEVVMYIMIGISGVATISRLIILGQLQVLHPRAFIQQVVLNVASVSGLIFSICYWLLPEFTLHELLSFVLRTLSIEVVVFSVIWILGLNRTERNFVLAKIGVYKSRFSI